MRASVIEIEDVTVRLGARLVLDRVSLACGKGELICVLGPNGAGKTTLLKAIAGLVAVRGRITLEGRNAPAIPATLRARIVAYLPQGHVAHWPITALEAVAIGRMPHGGGPGRTTPADAVAIDRALAAVDAVALAGRPVTELSGGERARVMLARALAVEAPVLLADEPIAALDPAHQLMVMDRLADAARQGATVLAALHDLTLAARYATRVIVLDAGGVAADGPPAEVLTPRLLGSVFHIQALHLEHAGAPLLVPWSTPADLRT